ncbi:hypothetical protein RRG08_059068 [Elysia crispata]|uniref:Lipocalin/cytosolic fatty-acid binding domain-containing protein n=1 Tax=Elysia crispata TaxID=231223 RepID=A0AAE1B9N6_9GAST|nr:hypothetical protein RRG08_059068 [Elysia crispata]
MDGGLGTWKVDIDRSPGVEAFAIASGTPKELCTEEVLSKTLVTISMDGDEFTSKTEIPGIPTKEYKFKLGVPFEYDAPDGRKFKVTTTLEEGKAVERITTETGDEITTVREMSGNEMKATTTAMGQTVTQYLVKA